MDDKGNIHELSEEESKKLHMERLKETHNRARHAITPITSDEAAFFKTKGMAFRELWGKRLARGLTVDQKAQLDSLVELFKNGKI